MGGRVVGCGGGGRQGGGCWRISMWDATNCFVMWLNRGMQVCSQTNKTDILFIASSIVEMVFHSQLVQYAKKRKEKNALAHIEMYFANHFLKVWNNTMNCQRRLSDTEGLLQLLSKASCVRCCYNKDTLVSCMAKNVKPMGLFL